MIHNNIEELINLREVVSYPDQLTRWWLKELESPDLQQICTITGRDRPDLCTYLRKALKLFKTLLDFVNLVKKNGVLWKEAVIHLGKLQEDYHVFINQPQSGEMEERSIYISEAVKLLT